jgi:N-acetylmuramoyl-L-alanine amidase
MTVRSPARFWLSILLLLAGCTRSVPPGELVVTRRVPVCGTRPGVLICLDAGHGGHDPGCASSCGHYQEKNLTLATTLMAKAHLENLGYQVVLTREDDAFVELRQRAQIANEAQCTLFVSLHYNAARNRNAEGIEVYCYSKKVEGDSTPAYRLATRILNQLTECTHAASRGVKEENYAVLRLSAMPAVLVEAGFLSNERECKKLVQPRYLNAIAWAVSQGIHGYLSDPY